MRLLRARSSLLIATCVFVTMSNGLIDEIIRENIADIFERWDIKFITIFRCQHQVRLATVGKHSKGVQFWNDCLNHNMRVNTIQSDNVNSISAIQKGAIFHFALSELPQKHLVELIAWSSSSKPLFLCSLRDTSLPAWLRKTRIPFTSNVYVILQDAQQPGTLTLQGVYHLHEDSDQLTVELVGRRALQGPNTRWTFFGPKADVLRRTNLQGHLIKTIFPALLYLPDTRGMEKFFENTRSILTLTLHAMNASVEPVVVHEADIVGSRDADGAWTGSLGMLQRLEGDLSAVMFSASTETEAAVDASHPFTYAKNYLFLRKPTFEFSLSATLGGFSWQVWLASCLALMSLAATLSFINYIGHENNDGFDISLDISKSILEVLGDLCLQGWARLPTSKSGLVVVVISILLGYILNLLYANQLTAGLSLADQAPLPFRTLDEMVAVKSHLPMVFRGSWTHVAAQVATEGPYKSLNELLNKHGSNAYFTNVRAGMQLMCQERVVMFIWDINVRPLLSKMTCTIVSTNVGILPRYISFGARKQYPYLPQINYFLRRIAEGGIIQRFFKYFKMDEVAQGEFKEIEFSNVVPFLLLYGVALGASIIIFVCEVLYSKFKNSANVERHEHF